MTLNNMYSSNIEELMKLTKKILDARDSVEAERLLFSYKDELSYVITNFMILRETLLTKVMLPSGKNDYKIEFDLEQSRKFLWDLLFLAEVAKRKCTDLGALRNSLAERRKLGTDPEGGVVVNFGEDVLPQELKEEYAYSYDENIGRYLLSEDTALYDDIVDSISIFDIIRNAFGHNENGKNCVVENGMVRITNSVENNSIDSVIPYRYLVQFGSGIIPYPEDKAIADAVDFNHAAIFNICNFCVSDCIDFLKKTSKERLEFLIELVDHDYSKLFKLPAVVFNKNVSKDRIYYFLKGSDGQVDKSRIPLLGKFPTILFYSNTMYNEKIVNEILGDPKCIDNLLGVSNSLLKFSDDAVDMIKYLTNDCIGFNIKEIGKYPKVIFSKQCSTSKIKNILALFSDVGEGEKRDCRVLKDLPPIIFKGITNISRISRLLEGTNDYSKLKDLPAEVFSHECLDEKVQVLMSHGNGLEVIKNINVKVFSNYFTYNNLMFLLNYDGTVFDNPKNLLDLPDYFFSKDLFIDNIKRWCGDRVDIAKLKDIPKHLIIGGIDSRISMAEEAGANVLDLPPVVFSSYFSFENAMYLFGLNVDIENVVFEENSSAAQKLMMYQTLNGEITQEQYNDYKRELYFFTVCLKDRDLINKIKLLPEFCFHSSTFVKRLQLFIENGYTVETLSNIPEIFFKDYVDDNKVNLFLGYSNLNELNDKVKYKNLYKILSLDIVDATRISYLLGNEMDVEITTKLPFSLFCRDLTDDKLDALINLVGGKEKLAYCPPAIYVNWVDIARIEFLYKEICNGDLVLFANLPSACCDNNVSFERIRSLKKYCKNGNEFNRLPAQLFTCEDTLVDTMMNEHLNVSLGMMKSLFGTGDSKLIAMALLTNAVFTVSDVDKTKLFDISGFDLYFNRDGKVNSDFVCRPHDTILKDSEAIFKIMKDIDSVLETSFSVGKIIDIKHIFNLTDEEIVRKYRDFSVMLDNILIVKFISIVERINTCVRNCSAHFHVGSYYVNRGEGEEKLFGLTDYVVGEEDGVQKPKEAFSSLITYDDAYKYVSDIYSSFLDSDRKFIDDEQFKESLKTIIKFKILDYNRENGTNIEFDTLYSDFINKINNYKKRIKKVIAIYLCVRTKELEINSDCRCSIFFQNGQYFLKVEPGRKRINLEDSSVLNQYSISEKQINDVNNSLK